MPVQKQATRLLRPEETHFPPQFGHRMTDRSRTITAAEIQRQRREEATTYMDEMEPGENPWSAKKFHRSDIWSK